MLRRLCLVLICALAPLYAAHAIEDAPLSVEMFIGAGGGEVRLIWVPTRWPSAPVIFEVRRRPVGATNWENIGRAQSMVQMDENMLRYAEPADFARLREELLSDFLRAEQRGFAYSDEDARGLPPGEYEYGVFAWTGGRDILVASAPWRVGEPQAGDDDVGLEVLGAFRDAQGPLVMFRADPRRMAERGKIGVRLIETRNGLTHSPVASPMLMAKPTGWSVVCHRLEPPLPESIRAVAEDMFGFGMESDGVVIPRDAALAPPPVPLHECMPVRKLAKPVYRMPPAKLSGDFDLIVGADRDLARILWIPKRWPAGVEAMQVMRRRAGKEWQAVGEPRPPSQDYISRLTSATPADITRIRRDLRSGWIRAVRAGFTASDYDFKRLPPGVVEYGLFAVSGGKQSAEPLATAPWLVGTKLDLDFGQDTRQWSRGRQGPVARFSLNSRKFRERGGQMRIFFMLGPDRQESLVREISAHQVAPSWKSICETITDGDIRAVQLRIEDVLGFESISSLTPDAEAIAAAPVLPDGECHALPAIAVPHVSGR